MAKGVSRKKNLDKFMMFSYRVSTIRVSGWDQEATSQIQAHPDPIR
jgi:hypothetical protein